METISEKPVPRLPIHTCEGLLEKLKWDHNEFKQGWTEYRTFNFVVTAYHLYADWIDRAGSAEQKKRKKELPDLAKLLFKVLRDITNATKHWTLNTGSQSRQVVSGVTSPQIADWYSYFIAGPVIYVTVGESRPSLPELADVTIKCFDWLLRGGEAPFPTSLEQELSMVFRPLVSESNVDSLDT
ncbi:MAG TPA: hypothetical protein VN642_14995 [Dongiaceae bacterium]|nr:hypothetical protein [Dongiaceae bacterium]